MVETTILSLIKNFNSYNQNKMFLHWQ